MGTRGNKNGVGRKTWEKWRRDGMRGVWGVEELGSANKLGDERREDGTGGTTTNQRQQKKNFFRNDNNKLFKL